MSSKAMTPYEEWAQREGIPILRGYSVPDLRAVKLEPWVRKGGLGAFVNLEGGQGWLHAYLCEIPPGGKLKPQRHLFEEEIFVLTGEGETAVWNEGGPKRVLRWREGSVFSPPLNSSHQHANKGERPARYVAVTNAPMMINLYRNPDFIFGCNLVLRKRFDGEENYFHRDPSPSDFGPETDINFVPNALTHHLPDRRGRGKGAIGSHFRLSKNSMVAHISEFPAGTYKKAHRHSPAAHIVVLQGRGYSLIWPEGGEKVRIDWRPGALFSPPESWFHQHFNVGNGPGKYLALRKGTYGTGKKYRPNLSLKLGGDQIEYEDEGPEIRLLYEEEMGKAGLEVRM